MVNAPAAWQNPENIVIRDNRNHLSEPLGYWANVSGGLDNRARGAYSIVPGGQANIAEAPYSSAQGHQAHARRGGEDALAAGAFRSPGDAQSSVVVARAQTTGAQSASLETAGKGKVSIPAGATLAFRALIVARGEGGRDYAAFEATGVASSGAVAGLQIRPVHSTNQTASVAITASNAELILTANGIAGATLRWVARLELVEVEF